jgi:hypothetical protein
MKAHLQGVGLIAVAALLAASTIAQPQTGDADPRDSISERPGTPIPFYGHVFSTGRNNPMPMNTQYPAGADDYSRGIFGNCGTYHGVPTYVLTPGPGVGYDGPCEEWTQNENWWYTTAGFVQIKSLGDFSYDQLHNERGQTKDIYFDLAQPITATYWMSADFHAWSTAFCAVSWCWNWDPGYFQNWVVEATVYHGSLGEHHADPSEPPDMGMIYGNPDATVIAYGRDGPKDLISIDSTVPADAVCGGPCRTVNPFDITLEYDNVFIAQGGIVPKENDVVVRIQWYQEEGDERYMLGLGVVVGTSWNVNAGEDYPPTITFPIKNPLDVELVFPRFIHDKLVILSVVNTPWGSYDVDLDSILLEVRDAAGTLVAVDPRYLQSDLEVSVAHSGHFIPIDVTYVWDYQLQDLPPGDYTATVKAANFQHSYSTETVARFTITEEGTGGATSYGTEGLLSFTDDEFQQFNEGAAAGAGQQDAGAGDQETQDSPLVAGPLTLVALAGVAAIAWRRRQ